MSVIGLTNVHARSVRVGIWMFSNGAARRTDAIRVLVKAGPSVPTDTLEFVYSDRTVGVHKSTDLVQILGASSAGC